MFEVSGKIVLTKPVYKEAEDKVKTVIEELKNTYSKRGNDFSYSLSSKKDHLSFKFESKEMASVTDLLVQTTKNASANLGKELRVGVKEVSVNEYTVEFDLEEAPKGKVNIPFVEKLSFKGKTGTLVYKDIPFDQIKNNYVEKTINHLKSKIQMANYEGKDEYRETIWEGKERKVTYKGDPAEDLEKINWIRRTPAKGQFVFGREVTALMNVIKELMVEHVYEPLGFSEMLFPKFEPWVIPKKSGHAKNIYPNAYFVMTPKNANPDFWEEVMDKYSITGEVQTDLIKEKSDCVGIMSYAQCPPFWTYLEGKVIDEATLPLLVYDWSGPTYRNEAGGTHGLDRVEEFHRIETLFVGTKEQISDTWQKLKTGFTKFFDEVMDIEIRVAKVTPWWMAHAGIEAKSENTDVGTFDFDAYLPYRGDRSKEWLEIQNDSSNGDKYPIAFKVRSKKQEFLWSGCAGASLERLMVAMLAQKGIDPKNWPKEIRKRFEKKTKHIKALKYY
jgi:seryl-tRNA synthetase